MAVPALALSALRALALRRTSNAAAKVRRIERQGINISGSEFDPRRPAANIRRYNRQQLQSYISRLDNFTARSTQFVAGRNGAPIPRADFNLYKQTERIYNARAQRFAMRNANLPLPAQDLTVGDLVGTRTVSRINAPDNTMLPQRNIAAQGIPSARALRQSRRELFRRMGDNYRNFRVNAAKTAGRKAWRALGLERMEQRFNRLTRGQLEYLFFDTDFYERLFAEYPEDGDEANVQNEGVLDDYLTQAESLDI